MARMPAATWRPVPNCTKGGQQAVYGVVLHIMEGTLDGSDSWFRNPSSQASAHFGVGKDGRIYQWVDTADRAWAQSAGNRTWLSIEHEGHTGDTLTAAQLAATARIVAWAHQEHGVLLQPTDSVTGRGVGWHGMGGADWGGHYDCPGNPIKAQRAAIIAAAKGGTTTVQEDDMPTAKEIAQAVADHTEVSPTSKRPTRAGAYWAYADARHAQVMAQLGALTGLVTKLAAGGGLTTEQAQAAAEAGATAALEKLGHALTD